MFINPKDLPFAAAMCVVLLLSICAVLEEWPRPHWRTVVTLEIAGGVALGTRVGAAVAAFDLVVPLTFWLVAAQWRAGFRTPLAASAGGCAESAGRIAADLGDGGPALAVGSGHRSTRSTLSSCSHIPMTRRGMPFEGRMVPASERFPAAICRCSSP